MPKRFFSIFMARNKEYFRDRNAFYWNFFFPFLIIVGFFILFQRGAQTEFKCGMIPSEKASVAVGSGLVKTFKVSETFKVFTPDTSLEATRIQGRSIRLNDGNSLLKFIRFDDRKSGFEKLRIHKLDMLIETDSDPIRYWINTGSPKGIIAESLFLHILYSPKDLADKAVRETVTGDPIHYIDWLFPGIIAMNMMFSSLYGVGYSIVRYRRNGVLKRLRATPLTAFEYLTAQIISRMCMILFSNVIVYAGCAFLFKFQCKGSYLDLILLFTMGGISMISLSLVIASRISSEELFEGVLNMASWPMMFLSQVWFSTEGASEWVRRFSQFLPLTHVTEGMRRIMNEGASLGDLSFHFIVLFIMSIIFMTAGSFMFKWTKD